jgi:hypothetical protein
VVAIEDLLVVITFALVVVTLADIAEDLVARQTIAAEWLTHLEAVLAAIATAQAVVRQAALAQVALEVVAAVVAVVASAAVAPEVAAAEAEVVEVAWADADD